MATDAGGGRRTATTDAVARGNLEQPTGLEVRDFGVRSGACGWWAEVGVGESAAHPLDLLVQVRAREVVQCRHEDGVACEGRATWMG